MYISWTLSWFYLFMKTTQPFVIKIEKKSPMIVLNNWGFYSHVHLTPISLACWSLHPDVKRNIACLIWVLWDTEVLEKRPRTRVAAIQFRFLSLAISDAVVEGFIEILLNLVICVCASVNSSFFGVRQVWAYQGQNIFCHHNLDIIARLILNY